MWIEMLPLVLAVVVTCCSIKLFIPISSRLGLIDIPGGRKLHDGAVPVIGGIGMFLGLVVSGMLFSSDLVSFLALALSLAIIMLVGVLDDQRDLSVKARFFAQILATLLMVFVADVCLIDLGDLLGFGNISLGWFAVPFTVFCVVGVINAMNMLDGIDGLAGSISLVIFVSMAALAFMSGAAEVGDVLLVYVAVITAFLLFNVRAFGRKSARIFMGDAGSMFLGFSIAWFLIDLSQGDKQAFSPVTALWIFALPLIDTCSIMLRRVRRGQSPFKADREHLHHFFERAGFSINQTLVVLVLAQSLFCLIGLLGHWYAVPEFVMLILFIALFSAYYFVFSHAWRAAKFIKGHSGLFFLDSGSNSGETQGAPSQHNEEDRKQLLRFR